MHPDQLDGELMLAPGFPTPPNSDYVGYHNYINEHLPPENPHLYGKLGTETVNMAINFNIF